jgi:hypothetical protein
MNETTRRYLQDNLADKTDAELAAELAADLRTADELYTDDLSGYLTGCEVLFPTYNAWKARLLTEEQSKQLEPLFPAFANIDYILTHLRGVVKNGRTVGGFSRTTDQAISEQMHQMIGAFQMFGLLTPEEGAGFIALAKGYMLDKLTEGEIAVERARIIGLENAMRLRNMIEQGRIRTQSLITKYEQELATDPVNAMAPAWSEIVDVFNKGE